MDDTLYEEDGFFKTIWGKLFLFFNPFLIGFTYIYLLYLIIPNGSTFWVMGGGIFAYFFPPAGKESVIPIVVTELTRKGLYAPHQIIFLVASSIAFVDIITSYFLLWNFYIAEKIPLIGDWIVRFQNFGAQKMKEKPWIKKLAYLGIALFVVIPFQGSGGVGASIMGRVIGMNKYHTWFSIIIGSFTGCFLIASTSYFVGDAILRAFRSSIFQGIGSLLVVITILVFLYFFTKNYLAEKEEST